MFAGILALAAASLAAGSAGSQETATEAATSVAAPAAATLHYADKWRLEVSEGADNDGVMHFRDHGEDVLVKKRNGPDFAIKLVESTVKGTRVNLNRE